MDKYLYVIALFILPAISSMLEAVDDFEVPEEITFSKTTPGPVQMRSKKSINTEGRTRAYREMRSDSMDDHTLNITKYNGEMVDNYCCFWVYQAHPPIPQTWQMSDYPFDFNFNGMFVANNKIHSPAKRDQISPLGAQK